MSTATLNVWVTGLGEPCRIEQRHQWYVHVLHCDGEILTWCDRRYTNLPTKCGHLEVDVPPGCYVVCATWSPGTDAQHLGNHLTHNAVIQVACGDHVCVNLFTPTAHHCGTWFVQGLRDAERAGRLQPGLADRAEEVVRELFRAVPPDPFTERTLRLGAEGEGEGGAGTAEVKGRGPERLR